MRRLASLLILTGALPVYAQVRIEPDGKQWKIKGSSYEAVVAEDGCLTNLRIHGVEFLAPGVDVSRGSYFYLKSVQSLPNVDAAQENEITATGDTASIRYQFEPEQMTWTLSNRTDETMQFFVILDERVNVVINAEGKLTTAPVNEDWKDSTWFKSSSRLELHGSDLLRGPWGRGNQVWHVLLSPKAQKSVSMRMGKASAEELARVAKVSGDPVGIPIWIVSPREYQVFQRHKLEEGRAFVSGRLLVDADRAEACAAGKSHEKAWSSEWQALSLHGNSFQSWLPLPSGGWYRLQVRALKDGKVVGEGVVERIGVGEVFVGAGQSNSTNCGEEKINQTSGMVASFSGNHWQIANDPQPGTHDQSKGGSFWPAFGDSMYERYGVPIGVAVTGHGGTSVNQWQPGSELFQWTMTRIQQLGPGGFRALLWHQGESDAVAMDADTYFESLQHVIVEMKKQAGWDFPWFVAQATYHNAARPSFEGVRAGQKRLWDEGVAFEGPDTDTLTGDYRDVGGKGIHFSPKGLKEHGEMWAEYVARWLDHTP